MNSGKAASSCYHSNHIATTNPQTAVKGDNKMKTFKIIIISILILITCSWITYHTHHYNRQATIVDIECMCITAKDNTGHYWEFNGSGYYVGQEITLKMYDNHTDDIIKDDSVKGIIK